MKLLAALTLALALSGCKTTLIKQITASGCEIKEVQVQKEGFTFVCFRFNSILYKE